MLSIPQSTSRISTVVRFERCKRVDMAGVIEDAEFGDGGGPPLKGASSKSAGALDSSSERLEGNVYELYEGFFDEPSGDETTALVVDILAGIVAVS